MVVQYFKVNGMKQNFSKTLYYSQATVKQNKALMKLENMNLTHLM